MDIKPKTILGDYEIQTTLARGRYADVYKAKKLTDDSIVAIKFVSKSKHLHISHYIEQEKKVVAILKPHPNLVEHFHYVENEDAIFFVMEYINGYNLSREISSSYYLPNNSIPFSAKKDYILQIITGVKFLHSQNIYHCDIKPDNVLLFDDKVKIVDFGCSIISERSVVENIKKRINTTPGYTPPEMLERNLNDLDLVSLESIDVWGIGCLIYYSFTGIFPFGAEKYKKQEIFLAVKNLNIDLSLLPDVIQPICKAIFVKDFSMRINLDELEELFNQVVL